VEGGLAVHLDPFELHQPDSLDATVRLAQEHQGKFDYLAGGTDLLPNYKMHLNLRPHLIALQGVPELRGRSLERLGAMERLADLEADLALAAAYPGLHEALSSIATPLVRASGTLGGNLLLETRCFFFNQSWFWRDSLGYCLKAEGDRCHVVPQKEKCYATFSGDLAPMLMALGATVELAGPGGRRNVPLRDLYDPQGDGIRRTTLVPAELLVAVRLPSASAALRSAYRKLRIRPSFDFPELGVAVALRLRETEVAEAHVAIGGLDTYPRSFDEEAQVLVGSRMNEEAARRLGEAIRAKVRPVRNTSLAPDYRKKMTSVFVRRAVLAAAGQGGGR
jgi:4-hydroxybenzoyl-CoA reductase subunit beta